MAHSSLLPPRQREGNSAFAISIGLLMLRLALGAIFIFHGAQLALGCWGGPGLAAFCETAPIKALPILPPAAWAAMAAYGQLLGGVGVLLGMLTRLAVLPIMGNMFVAIIQVHASHGFSLQNGGYEYNLLILGACTMLMLSGGGLVSVDAFIFRRGVWARGAQPG